MELRNREIQKTAELDEIINEAEVCYVAMVDKDQPYMVPMNFAFADNSIYLHCDPKGYKIDLLENNPSVCINFNVGNELFYRHKQVGCSWGMKYKSVNVFGQAVFIDDYDMKYKVMQLFMKKYSGENYEFSEPAIKNVKIVKIPVEKITGKKYGY